MMLWALYAFFLLSAALLTYRMHALGNRLEALDETYREALAEIRETAALADDAADARIEIVYRAETESGD